MFWRLIANTSERFPLYEMDQYHTFTTQQNKVNVNKKYLVYLIFLLFLYRGPLGTSQFRGLLES